MKTTQKLGRPPRISRESVLTGALKLVDDHGVEALTMRRLGVQLGVDPMAVYHYFPNKASLFDGIVERLFGEVEVPSPSGDWEEDLREIATAARTSMLRHGGALVLLATRPPTTPEAFKLLDADISERDAADGIDCLGRLLIGHLVAEAGISPGAEPEDAVEDRHTEAQAELDPERFPGLATIAQASVEHDPQRLFELGLEGLILALRSHPRRPGTDPGPGQ